MNARQCVPFLFPLLCTHCRSLHTSVRRLLLFLTFSFMSSPNGSTAVRHRTTKIKLGKRNSQRCLEPVVSFIRFSLSALSCCPYFLCRSFFDLLFSWNFCERARGIDTHRRHTIVNRTTFWALVSINNLNFFGNGKSKMQSIGLSVER